MFVIPSVTLFLFGLYFVVFPEGKVDAKAEIGPGMIDGDKLFGVLCGKIVGTDEEVESRSADIENGSHGTAHIGNRAVECEMQCREGTEIDGGHAFGISAITHKTGGGEEAEGDGVVE